MRYARRGIMKARLVYKLLHTVVQQGTTNGRDVYCIVQLRNDGKNMLINITND
jgi:hypothetical protein